MITNVTYIALVPLEMFKSALQILVVLLVGEDSLEQICFEGCFEFPDRVGLLTYNVLQGFAHSQLTCNKS